MQIYEGQTAKQKCTQILKSYQSNSTEQCLGFWFEDGVYIAFDNSSKDCWVEEFQTLKQAINYLAI